MLSDRGIALCTGGLFLVKGEPREAADAILLYYPSPSAPNFMFQGTSYTWNRQHPNLDFMRQHPEYVSEKSTTRMSISPAQVRESFDPFNGYGRIAAKPRDPVEETALGIGKLLESVGVPAADIGITASMLIECHNEKYSDIDLVVRGRQNFDAARSMAYFSPMTSGWWLEYFMRYDIGGRYGIGFDDFYRTAARKNDRFMFRGRQVSIFNVRNAAERRFFDNATDVKNVRVRGTVAGDKESSFYPSFYGVRINSADQDVDTEAIREIVSLGRDHYLELFSGDSFECEGMLQKTPEGFRVLVDYIGDDLRQRGFLKLT